MKNDTCSSIGFHIVWYHFMGNFFYFILTCWAQDPNETYGWKLWWEARCDGNVYQPETIIEMFSILHHYINCC